MPYTNNVMISHMLPYHKLLSTNEWKAAMGGTISAVKNAKTPTNMTRPMNINLAP